MSKSSFILELYQIRRLRLTLQFFSMPLPYRLCLRRIRNRRILPFQNSQPILLNHFSFCICLISPSSFHHKPLTGFSLPDHHQSHHKKDCRRDPYCSDSKPYGKNTTNSGSYGKYKNNTKEMQSLVQGSLLFCSEIL